MNSAMSWSVKGIDPQTREAAKTAARRSGQTLGQWLNQTIIGSADDEPAYEPSHLRAPAHSPRQRGYPDVDARVDYLEHQLAEITHQQSDTAINRHYRHGMHGYSDDHSMQFLLERISRSETETLQSFKSLHSRLDQITEALSDPTPRNGSEKSSSHESFEQALSGVVDHIETTDTATRDALRDLADRLEDVSVRSTEATSGRDHAGRKILEEVEQQLTALTQRVDLLGEKVAQPAAGGRDNRVDNIVQRVENTEKQAQSSMVELRRALEKRLHSLGERVDSVATASQQAASKAAQTAIVSARNDFGNIEQQLAQLQDRIETSSGDSAQTDGALSDLREEISTLTGDVDLIKHHAASERDLQTLREMLENLSHTMEEKSANGASEAALAEIEHRLADLALRFNKTLENPPSDPMLEKLERRIHDIDARLASQQDDNANGELLAHVDQKLSSLANRLGATEQGFSGIQDMEKSIAQLFESVEQTRNQAGEEAKRAVGKVAKQLQAAQAGTAAPDGAVEAVQQGLTALKASAESADQRTQETLEAVHDTLEKIVARLVTLENAKPASATPAQSPMPLTSGDMSGLPPRPGETLPQDPAMPGIGTDTGGEQASWRTAIDAKSAKEMEDILAGAPATELNALELDAPQSAAAEADAPEHENISRRSDFIAAARRAAQVAAEEEGVSTGKMSRFQVLRRKKKTAEDVTEGASEGEPRKKRRPLILAAIVLLLIGAVSAYNMLGKTRPTETSALAPAPQIQTQTQTQILPQTTVEPEMLDIPVTPTMETPLEATGPAPQPAPTADLELSLPPGPGTSEEPVVAVSPAEPLPPLDASVPLIEQRDPLTTGSVPPAPIASSQDMIALDPMLSPGGTSGFSLAPAPPTRQPAATVENGPAIPNQIVERTPLPNAGAEASGLRAPDAGGASEAGLPPAEVGPISLRRAAASGDPIAQFVVGSKYTDGDGIQQDFRLAAMWYQRAAARGLAPAQYRLATFYEKGRGVPQDLSAARIWYERAAEKGNRTAMHNLAVIYADGSRGEPNFAKAALWFRNAAELGLRDSQYNLGILHERGLGVEQNVAQAYQWFALAARQGDTDAEARLGIIEARLTAQQLLDVKLAIEGWRPQASVADANTVTPTVAGWTNGTQNNASSAPQTSTRERVSEVQSLLNRIGYDTGVPDGIIGVRTREAIVRFEAENGLNPTGRVSPQLVERLRAKAG